MTFDIGKIEKAKLKAWMSEAEGSYDIIIRLLAKYIATLKDTEVTGDSEFHVLRDLHTMQGKVAGAKEFLELIEKDIS